jgi:protein-S-isoprenylcysteine O-methyltransferase Ste14
VMTPCSAATKMAVRPTTMFGATTALVTDGIFRRTRNPLYVGVSVALCGIALIFALDWMLVLIVPSCVILHFAVVRREESYLEGKFGEAYRRYKERVPRYLLD